MEQFYVAICVNTRYGRAGIVINGTNPSKVLDIADSMPNRIGYVGGDDFQTAVRRAGMMERDELNAWGPLCDCIGCRSINIRTGKPVACLANPIEVTV